MNAPSSTPTSTIGRGLRGIAGVMLTLFMVPAMVSSGAEMGAMGGWAVALVMGTSLLLLVSCFMNWPILWNMMGRLLRALLGERGARVALGLLAIMFALGAMVSTVPTTDDAPVVAHATTNK